MSQLLLFPDPRPLVERLGAAFFRQAPEGAGVYLMRDATDRVLYVGKAKSIRRRLAAYRVANPDRLPHRHLRLLQNVARIELHECPDESAALGKETELLRELQPPFNRAGTWPGPRRFVAWRGTADHLELAVSTVVEPGWAFYGPMGAGALHVRALLARLCWRALHPDRGLAGMPEGWSSGRLGDVTAIPGQHVPAPQMQELPTRLAAVFDGDAEPLAAWVLTRTAAQTHPFEIANLGADLEALREFAQRLSPPAPEAGHAVEPGWGIANSQ
ncbi:MAG TPA: GIY-YIG nuclease family protein [Candidatus Acidoferrum sp.]|nr:GIY-YIG nuclease family protein [Candidatus Acidoferrum sp.]